MRFTALLCLTCLPALNVWASESPPQATGAVARPAIVYRLSTGPPTAREYHVSVEADSAPGESVKFAIPAWAPGYYHVLDYQHHILHVSARDETGRRLEVEHAAQRIWSVSPSRGASRRITLEYDVDTDEAGLDLMGCSLDFKSRIGFISGASTFVYLMGRTAEPVQLRVTLPANWGRAFALPASARRPWATVDTYSVPSYDALIDSPIQIGQFDELDFRTDGVPFRCVVAGDHHTDMIHLTANLKRIAHAEIGIFGKAPFRQYTFFFHVGGAGFTGGIEHCNATVIHVKTPIGTGDDDTFLSVCAHELFHAWNVKWLHPAGLGPFDYTQLVRTPSLWWAEGVTDYYSLLALVRAGLRDAGWLGVRLSARIARLDSTSARQHVTLEEASLKSWEGGGAGYGGLSYYLKGSLVGFYLDLRLRALTSGRKGLDDVIRRMATLYASRDKAYPDDAILVALNAVSGASMDSEYTRCVRSTSEIDWAEAMEPAGLALRHGPTRSAELQMAVISSDRSCAAAPKIRKAIFGRSGQVAPPST